MKQNESKPQTVDSIGTAAKPRLWHEGAPTIENWVSVGVSMGTTSYWQRPVHTTAPSRESLYKLKLRLVTFLFDYFAYSENIYTYLLTDILT